MNQLKTCLALVGAAFVGVALHTLIPEGHYLDLVLLTWGAACIAVALHD